MVNYNRKDECLLTIIKTKQLTGNKNFEIIVVDNASTTEKVLERFEKEA